MPDPGTMINHKHANMIRNFIIITFLFATFTLCAQETHPVDLKLLMALPERRHAELILDSITANDSTPDISRKRENYYNSLKQIAQELRQHYYWHDEFPTNVFAGIEERANVLVATDYPLSNATGSSYVDFLTESYRIQMAEQTVSFMAKAILGRFKDDDLKTQPAPNFSEWNQQWKKAGKVPNGPNQNLAPINN
jgi:hypothetical protein